MMGTGLSASVKFVTMPQATSVNTCELPTLVVPGPGWLAFAVRLLVSGFYFYFSAKYDLPLPVLHFQLLDAS